MSNLPTPFEESDPGEPSIDTVAAELSALVDEAESLSSELSDDPGTALVALTGTSPTEMKARMANVRANVLKKQQQITAKQAELKALLERKMSEVDQVIRPLKAMVKKLEEGIWTANLYLGRDEEITTLRDGTPADPNTPITVRQLVLAMDEECAANELDGGIDAMSISAFDKWLLASDDHLNLVFPEPRGVIALVPRFTDIDYGNPWESTIRNQENHQTYFLIRNGERLYSYITDFIAGERLIPTASEFTDFFYETRSHGYGPDWHQTRSPIEPGTSSWEKAESQADARKRHYMRVGLILQGLVDRTTVFQPLVSPVRFLEPDDYDAGRINIVADGDLLLDDGHEPFRDYQRRLIRDLRPGMRIIGAFNTYDSRDEWTIYPKTASYPDSYVPHTLTERPTDRSLKFTYERTDLIWGYEPDPDAPGWQHYTSRTPAAKASCTFSQDSDLILPFDLVTLDDLNYYLNSRTERHRYVRMFPLLKAARRTKLDEAAAEAPFQLLLAGLLATANQLDVETTLAAVPDLISWYKLTNRTHRPLIGSAEDNAKAVRLITNEYALRLKDAARPLNATTIATLRANHPNALLIARRRDNVYVVLVPEDEGDVFVTEFNYTSRGVLKETLPWQLVGTRPARWTIAYTAPAYAIWNVAVDSRTVFSAPEIYAAAERLIDERTASGAVPIAVLVRDATRGERHRGTSLTLLELSHDNYANSRSVFSTPENYSDLELDEYWRNAKEHPLTAHYREPNITSYKVRLRRDPSGAPVYKRDFYNDSYPTGDKWPCWEPTGTYNKMWRQVLLVASGVALANKYHDIYLTARRHASDLSKIVNAYESDLCDQYNARLDERLYTEFITEYRDPELWQGHRKSLRPRYLEPCPRDFEDLDTAFDLLVEAGHVLSGLSVIEVMDRARVLFGYEGVIPNELDDFTLAS